MYVRPGSGRYSTPIGYVCTGCATVAFDDDWQALVVRMAAFKGRRGVVLVPPLAA